MRKGWMQKDWIPTQNEHESPNQMRSWRDVLFSHWKVFQELYFVSSWNIFDPKERHYMSDRNGILSKYWKMFNEMHGLQT